MKLKSAARHILVAAFLIGSRAQEARGGPGGWDQSFAPLVIGGPVYAAAVQPDGKLLVGGAFTLVNGSSSRARLARLFADGSLDATFLNTGSGVSSTIYCLTVQTDGRIVIGGDFFSVAGTPRTRVARLNANGTVDGSFIPTNAISGSVLAVAAQSDNKVIIGGNFSSSIFPLYNARLNADGSTDTVFSSFPNGPVNAIAVQPDGKIVIGGAFSMVNGAQRSRIARLNSDGSLDNTFQNGLSGASSTVRCLQIQPDGKILLGGDFSVVNNTTRPFVARLNSNGSLDTGFGSGTGPGGSVYAIGLQPDNSVVIGGSFTTVGNALLSRVARLYADGSRDTTFTNYGINNIVQALAIQSDGGLVIGGTFSTINNTNWSSLARLYGNLYPPEFLAQPVSRATNVGANVTFSALVNNPTPASYQWRKDGNNISGATGTAYSLFNVQLADTGNYSVFVNNSFGGVTSSNAVLSVGIAPAITQQPVSLTVTQGQFATFTVGATGTPLNYYWRKNGLSIPGATNSTLTFSNAVFANSGSYACLVSNFVGRATSAVAVLTVSAPPTITVQPAGSIVGVGSYFILTVTASGTAPLAYQWSKDSAPLAGSTDTSLIITNAQPGDSGAYFVTVTNALGSVSSAVANVSVIYFPPEITAQPVGQTLLVGSNFTLTVTATGASPLGYQWRKDGSDLAGASGTSCTVTSAQTNDTGAYTVVVTNVGGSSTSAVAQINVGYAPLIVQQPQPFTNNLGTSNAFTVVVSGSEPLLYQWFKDGAPIADATNHLLPLPNLQSNQVGYYSVTITNLYGWALSSNALLTIPGVPPSFLWQGLVAYYPFNGNANDASGNGNDGTVFGALLTTDRFGQSGVAYEFNGSNSVITATVSNRPTGSAPLTVAVWVKSQGPRVNGEEVLWWGAAQNGQAFQIYNNGIDWHAGGYGFGDDLASGVTVDTNWHSFVVSYDGSAMAIASDGVQAPPQPLILNTPTSNVEIGSATGGGPAFFSGTIDDVRIYNRALSSNEIAQLYGYEAGLPAISSQPQSWIVEQGSSVSMGVVVSSQHPITYQWSKDGVPISTATNATLLTANVQPSQAGLYTVAISNGFNGVLSAPAALVVMSTSGAGAPGFTSNLFGFGLSGPSGLSFVVEASTNLQQWTPVSTNTFSSGLFQFIDPASNTYTFRFYRTRL